MSLADDLNAVSADEAARAVAYRDRQHSLYFQRLRMERALHGSETARKLNLKHWEALINGPSLANPIYTPDLIERNKKRPLRRPPYKI